jgi:hypothetical protein
MVQDTAPSPVRPILDEDVNSAKLSETLALPELFLLAHKHIPIKNAMSRSS